MYIYILIPLCLTLVSCSKGDFKNGLSGQMQPKQCITALSESKKYDVNTFLHEVNDDILTGLVKSLDLQNNDLKIVRKRIEREHNNIKKVNFDNYPSLSINGGYGNSRILKNGYGSHDSFSVSSALSYDVDLVGERKINMQQAELNLNVSVAESRRLQLSILEDFLLTYWDVIKTNKELNFLKEERENYRLRLMLIESRFRNDLINPVDVYAARQIINDYDDQIQNINLEIINKQAKLAEFLDKPFDGYVPVNNAEEFSKKFTVPLYLPFDILGCKPEIKIAEYRLEAELKSLDLQYSRYYPKISLSTALSSASSFVDSLFSSPVRSLSASLSLPFIEWYKIDADVDGAKISVKEAELELRITVLNALTQVNNLIESQKLAAQMKESQAKSLELAKKRLLIANSRFNEGYSDLQSVLDSEIAYSSAQKAFISAEVEYYSSSIKMLVSVYGGELIEGVK